MQRETKPKNLWHVTKTILKGKLIVSNTYLEKQEKLSSKQPNFPAQ